MNNTTANMITSNAGCSASLLKPVIFAPLVPTSILSNTIPRYPPEPSITSSNNRSTLSIYTVANNTAIIAAPTPANTTSAFAGINAMKPANTPMPYTILFMLLFSVT